MSEFIQKTYDNASIVTIIDNPHAGRCESAALGLLSPEEGESLKAVINAQRA